MSKPGKVRALLATLRIANAPSVVSNVFLGYMVGWAWENHGDTNASFDPAEPSLLCLAGILLYFSGNLANDWFDRGWDTTRRPERALPAGLFSPGSYLIFAVLLAASGSALAFVVQWTSGMSALAIVMLIAVYTLYHKRSAWAVIPMGMCRAGLYFLGCLAWWPDLDHLEWTGYLAWLGHTRMSWLGAFLLTPACLAIGLFSYIAGLSLSARYESMEMPPQGPKIISRALLILPLAAMSCCFMTRSDLIVAGIAGMAPFTLWLALCVTRFRRPISRHVSALLAGIPLVDLIAAAPLSYWVDLRFPALLIVPPVAFLLSKYLQRIAPAT